MVAHLQTGKSLGFAGIGQTVLGDSMINKIFVAGLLISLTLIVLIMPIRLSSETPACSASQSSAWQICGPVQSAPPLGFYTQSEAIQANDQTLRMAWVGVQGSSFQIQYADRLLNGTWNLGNIVAGKSGTNKYPSLAQLNYPSNQTLFLFFTYKNATSKHSQLYYVATDIAGASFLPKYHRVPLINSTVFTGCALNGCNDTQPAATVGRDGTLYLVWSRDNTTRSGTGGVMRQLWYKTLKAGVWSTEQPLTLATDPYQNYQPSIMVGKDGVIRVAYSRGQSSTSIFQIYYATYNAGTWSPTPLTTQTSAPDGSPSIMQDRNGTLWVFWNRNLNEGSAGFAQVIYDRSSIDNGATWSAESALTAVSCNISGCTQSENPTAVQSTYDKYVWVFYASDPVSTLDIYALQSATCVSGSCTPRQIAPVHDITISYFSTSNAEPYQGGFHNSYAGINESAVVQVSATVTNPGDYVENVTLSLIAANTTNYNLGTQIILNVQPGGSGIGSLNFNTTLVKPAKYGISGNASILKETLGNKPDGLLSTSNQIHVLPLGDVDQDGSVTISDISVVFYNYGCTSPNYTRITCPTRPNDGYNPWADINGDGVIDIVDVAIVSKNYGILS